MSITVVEQLPLSRSKCEGIANRSATGAVVGPGTYNVGYGLAPLGNNSRAPFNTTTQRPPLSQSDPRVPGPGRYDVIDPEHRGIGVVSCPFASGSVRFPVEVGGERPGPGSYNLQGVWPHKRASRAHTFSALPHDQLLPTYNESRIGPGYYSPKHEATFRANPKVAQFSKYSGRAPDQVKESPGPGAYNLDAKPRSIYAGKPSSMFATKTTRNQYDVKDTPGPGEYETAGSLLKRDPACPAGRSAFGTSAPRFADGKQGDAPGPGRYTGEVAPRRPRYTGAASAYPFASSADRFGDTEAFGPGPGSYEGGKPPKRTGFGGEAPFGSTVPRSASTMQRHPRVSFDEAFGPANGGHQQPRKKSSRQFITGEIKPTTLPEPLPERSYDVKHDWPKPESTRSIFGAAPRMSALSVDNGVPGPGSYLANASPIKPARRSSAWSNEVRFPPTGI